MSTECKSGGKSETEYCLHKQRRQAKQEMKICACFESGIIHNIYFLGKNKNRANKRQTSDKTTTHYLH